MARSGTTTAPSASFETRVLVTARKFPDLGTGGDDLPEVPPVATQPRPVLTAAPTRTTALELPLDRGRSVALGAGNERPPLAFNTSDSSFREERVDHQ